MYDKMGCSGVWLLQEVLVKRNIVAMMMMMMMMLSGI